MHSYQELALSWLSVANRFPRSLISEETSLAPTQQASRALEALLPDPRQPVTMQGPLQAPFVPFLVSGTRAALSTTGTVLLLRLTDSLFSTYQFCAS